jgi:hypothetical protein
MVSAIKVINSGFDPDIMRGAKFIKPVVHGRRKYAKFHRFAKTQKRYEKWFDLL